MERLGYPYRTATDGLQAVEAYKSTDGKIDIIFMGMTLPSLLFK
jgi:CheY-like chemotaxis protein